MGAPHGEQGKKGRVQAVGAGYAAYGLETGMGRVGAGWCLCFPNVRKIYVPCPVPACTRFLFHAYCLPPATLCRVGGVENDQTACIDGAELYVPAAQGSVQKHLVCRLRKAHVKPVFLPVRAALIIGEV